MKTAEEIADVVRAVRPRSPHLKVRAICRLENDFAEPSDDLVRRVAELAGEPCPDSARVRA